MKRATASLIRQFAGTFYHHTAGKNNPYRRFKRIYTHLSHKEKVHAKRDMILAIKGQAKIIEDKQWDKRSRTTLPTPGGFKL